jgi:hypothetical protein
MAFYELKLLQYFFERGGLKPLAKIKKKIKLKKIKLKKK